MNNELSTRFTRESATRKSAREKVPREKVPEKVPRTTVDIPPRGRDGPFSG